ncbi:MAG: site-2 protease family protein [Bacteroidota bacterium]
MEQNKAKAYLRHLGLFLITLLTTTMAGAEWVSGASLFFGPEFFKWEDFYAGFSYSIPFLFILTVHEFGHYFTAMYYKVKATLPYYIPMYFPGLLAIGTLGAVIRLKSKIQSTKVNFDIGIAGPLAGFVAAIAILFYGFTNLPEPEHIYDIHPEYTYFGLDYAEYVYDVDTVFAKAELDQQLEGIEHLPDTIRMGPSYFPNLQLGSNLLFVFFEEYVVQDKSRLPNHHEMIHYPYLLAGFLALFFTALNLLPIGQLDGGHVVYGLFGSKGHKIVASIVFIGFIYYAGIGLVSPAYTFDQLLWIVPCYVAYLYMVLRGFGRSQIDTLMFAVIICTSQFLLGYWLPDLKGYYGWLLFGLIISRFLGIYHPKTVEEKPLDMKRKILGWLALIILILSFSPTPIVIG